MNTSKIANVIYFIAAVLVIVGGLNWLMVGLGKEDFVQKLFKKQAKNVYIAVGVSAIIVLVGNVMLWNKHKTELPFAM